jgi:dephospho-CoA kinase
LKTIGLTGGIGSGKSTVARFFSELGVPVYIADEQARLLTDTSMQIREEIDDLLGEEALKDNRLDRPYVASKVFADGRVLKALNDIIHPRVREHFEEWRREQRGPYCILEAAVLFENGSYHRYDQNILVVAPKELRIKRVMQRDGVSREEVEARMKHQWPDEKKRKLADHVIENINLDETRTAVTELHKKLSETR